MRSAVADTEDAAMTTQTNVRDTPEQQQTDLVWIQSSQMWCGSGLEFRPCIFEPLGTNTFKYWPMASEATAQDSASAAITAADAPTPAAAATSAVPAPAATSGAGGEAAGTTPVELSPEAIAKIFSDAGVPLPDDFTQPDGVDISAMSKKQLRKLVKRGGAKSGDDAAATKAQKTVRVPYSITMRRLAGRRLAWLRWLLQTSCMRDCSRTCRQTSQ